MASIKGKNTKPEIILRKSLWSTGFRYRIHDKTVFGTPDISNKREKLAIFVDGCFWHGCKKCYKEPKTNADFWRNKIKRNKSRRVKVRKYLIRSGFRVLEFWEHEINEKPQRVIENFQRFAKNKIPNH